MNDKVADRFDPIFLPLYAMRSRIWDPWHLRVM